MRNIALGFVVVFLLGGCVTNPTTPGLSFQIYKYARVDGQSQLITLPPLNSESEAEVGQNMVQAARKTVTPAIKITEEIFIEYVIEYGSYYRFRTQIKILPSQLLLIGTDPYGSYYQADIKYGSLTSEGGEPPQTAGVFVPNNEPALTQVFHSWSPKENQVKRTPHPGIKYETTTVDEWGTDSFRRELVYQGVSQNTVSIRYREFDKDMARPAFTEDLKYDLSQGDVIGYKGARFQIIKANNLSIRYKVLKPLD